MERRVRGVEVGVEDGDGEAAPVKDSGETEHGVHVAQRPELAGTGAPPLISFKYMF